MECRISDYYGHKRYDFEFCGRSALLVVPKEPRTDKKWVFKTEYFDAFPNFQAEMLDKGYYLAHISNEHRIATKAVTDLQADFAKFLHNEFGLYEKCMTIGMSCGGMQAIYLAGRYPELVGALYIDAPVCNLLSWPCAVGKMEYSQKNYDEFKSTTGMTLAELINYRNHPIDYADKIKDAGIPVMLICGGSDKTVIYEENGKVFAEKFKGADNFFEILKPECDHHPHGLEDNTPLFEFAEKYY